MSGRTVFTVLKESAKQHGSAVALHQPFGKTEPRKYKTYTWNAWLRLSSEIALGLRSLGLKKGEIVCILCETRAEFYLVDLGVMGAGGVAAALYTAYPMADLARNVTSARPRFLFVEDPKKLVDLRRALDALGVSLPEHVILITGEQLGALSLDVLRQVGRNLEAQEPSTLERVAEELSPADPAILYTTSGATGEPKMGLTSHAAILANLDMGPVVLPIGPADSTVVFLPSAHIAQRIVLELVPMRMGTPVWFSESLARMSGELRNIKPSVFLAPPRVWEKIYSTVQTELRKRPAPVRALFEGALSLSLKAGRHRRDSKPVPLWMLGVLAVADLALFRAVRRRLGGNLRIAASGAAPLGRDLADFYAAIGLPLIEGYGLTEAGILCFNPLKEPRSGSVGRALPGVKVRLSNDGELQVQTPCLFEGYYKDETATRSVMTRDGWFATGDVAEVDKEGFWYITGRKKELIVNSNGKKIYPTRIENFFKMEPLINQVLLVGDKKPYVTALLTLNFAQVPSTEGLENLKGRTPNEIAAAESVTRYVQQAVARVNKQLADFEKIRKFKVLDREFTIEQGELTPTMKIRRGRALENHRALVTELYLGKAPD